MHDELTADVFEARLRELLETDGRTGDNTRCVECVHCRACSGSTFCRQSERLVHCHYCIQCTLCMDCSHCRGSSQLVGCHHCTESQNCTRSSYLVRCVGLSQCSYCFGCVGLSGKDFHILNEPYDRTRYFEVTRRLAREINASYR